ncbi:ExeM/NucH family extracellular endonuclease [Bowmanella sp. Y26]|uniref:ExeM/NucH family extracellular endonuclease n=1 Tax=Bowmanella yangjiangensis TaxID=2811230 RepID=UPI001BDD7ABB|nr:ExeM/NucH family extracellular endonuclease [Bowmanella yangjiangensis]MBT1065519.1 ExeM/NucH family extracellular endonuclease [Bowmanella yangjiangensis]
MKTKLTLLSVAILASMQVTAAPADSLILTGVIDGPLTGGIPKAVELYVAKDIDDLSQCGVGFANNGEGTDGQEFTFPAQAVSAGTFLYVASESTGFTSFFGFSPDFTSGYAGVNGDDAIEVFCDGVVVDSYGDENVDGTGEVWDYLDGWAYRVASTGPDGATFAPGNWTFSGINALDGAANNASAGSPFPLKSFGSETDPGDGGDTGGNDDVIDGSVCFNCPDLSKIADAALFNDAQYYAPVIAAIGAGSAATEVKPLLTNTISNDHRVLSYSEVWTALTVTDQDPQNSNNVTLLYKGTSLAKSSNGSGSQSSNPDNWNREHVWPNSHGFNSQSFEAYTDIHHLRPTDISVNASRGNLDFDSSDSPLAEAPQNRIDSDSFEPRDAVKGDVARMMLYMDVRYEGADVTPDLQLVDRLTGPGEPALGKLCRLVEWHNADPVDSVEQNRNNAIYEFQGNRNPFIDHPEWVEVLYSADECDNGGGDNGGGDPQDPTPGEAGLIFSEYVEGAGGNNKAIELFNATGATLNLSGYQVLLYANGSTSAGNKVDLQGELASGETYVIANSGSNAEILAEADITATVTYFNGNDVLELRKNGQVVDSFGQVGNSSNFAVDVTLVRKPDIVSGDTDSSDTFDYNQEWINLGTNVFTNLGSHNGDVGGEPGNDIGLCGEDATLISAIQGSGAASPMVDQNKVIEGVVTNTVPNLRGYFVQEESSQWDNDNTTSEGIFVYQGTENNLPAVGSLVRVKGNVTEFYTRTQLAADVAPLDCGTATVEPLTISLPFASAEQPESFEGMLVNFSHVLTVNDNFNLGRYGDVGLGNGRNYIPTNLHAPGTPEAIALADQNKRNRIILDDTISAQNPNPVVYPTGGLSAQNTLRTGDTVTALLGNLDYSFNAYRVVPAQEPTFVHSNARTASPELTRGNVTVASLNVLNFFNGDGQGNGFPAVRGADDLNEYQRQLDKLVQALAAMDADVIGLMEIENDGYGELSAIAQLTEALNQHLGEERYAYVNPGVSKIGTDEIAVGLIYKPVAVDLVGPPLINNNSVFSRPPLAQRFAATDNGAELTVVVNHFKSKGCGGASGADADQGDGQSCYNTTRVAQAQALINWMGSDPTFTSNANHLVIGDLNAYAKEDPIRTFTGNGFTNLVETHVGAEAYSYAFGGEMGYLDHAIGSEALAEQVVDVVEWHINADEPRALDYDTQYNHPQFYAANPYRVSDHDPVLVSLNLLPPPVPGDFDGDGDVDRLDFTGLLRALAAKQTIDMSFDLNQDGTVNVRDAQLMRQLCTRTGCATE